MNDSPVAAPARTDRLADVTELWDFWQTFVELNRISVQIHDCHREICDLYQSAIMGDMAGYEYFVVNMPRRTGKTKILQALACWQFGEFDESQMLYGCYSEKLVMRTMAYIGATLLKPWFIDVYGDKVHTRKNDLVTTTAGGTLYGAGTAATVAGFGAGLKEPAGGFISLDDPAKPDASLSKVERENVVENFELTWKGCRNSDQFTPIIINAQRIGPDDLPGYVRNTYPNKTFTLKFPCVVGGFSQFPETWSDSTLADLQKTRLGRYVLASQFNQEPIALGGNLIPVDNFHRWNPSTIIKFERAVITCDTALKTKEANDFSCLALWGLFNKKAYLIDLAHGKWETPDLIANAVRFWNNWTGRDSSVTGVPRPTLKIEEKAAGTPLLQTLRRAPIGIPCTGMERDIDKVRRVQTILQYIETGMVVVPQDNSVPWVAKFLTECAEFKADGTAPHDDMVDTMVDAIEDLLGKTTSIFDVLMTRRT